MIGTNEILAELFQKRPEPDADGFFHYLLQEKDSALLIDTTPYRQWTPELLNNILMISCYQNEITLGWMNDGNSRATLGGPLPIETILYQEDNDEDDPYKRLVFVGSDIIAILDLPSRPLSFWIGSRDYFYNNIYEEQIYRVLS